MVDKAVSCLFCILQDLVYTLHIANAEEDTVSMNERVIEGVVRRETGGQGGEMLCCHEEAHNKSACFPFLLRKIAGFGGF